MAAQTFGKTWWGSEWLKSLTHMTVATGESWIGRLSNAELREIFR